MGSADREIVGEDVVSETVRYALLEIGLRLENNQSSIERKDNYQSGVAGWDLSVLLILCHDYQEQAYVVRKQS